MRTVLIGGELPLIRAGGKKLQILISAFHIGNLDRHPILGARRVCVSRALDDTPHLSRWHQSH